MPAPDIILREGLPITITDATNALGAASEVARGDHVHAHGDRGGGTLHALTTAFVAGFMSPADFLKLAGIQPGAAADILIFGSDSVASTVTTRFLTPGFNFSIAPTTAVQFRLPHGGVMRNLRVRQNVPAGNGNQLVYTLRVNGVATLLSVSMASTAADASDLVNTIAVVAGDLVDLRVTKALGIGTTPGQITAAFEVAGS